MEKEVKEIEKPDCNHHRHLILSFDFTQRRMEVSDMEGPKPPCSAG